jgi:hypothetical protein
LIFDALAYRATVGVVDVGHGFAPVAPKSDFVSLSQFPREAEPATINRASTSRRTMPWSGRD